MRWCADWWLVRRIGGGVATDLTLTERRDWFGSTTGLGGRRKFGGALAEGWWSGSEKPTSRKGREKWGTRTTDLIHTELDLVGGENPAERWLGVGRVPAKSPTSRKGREKWGTRLLKDLHQPTFRSAPGPLVDNSPLAQAN